MKFWQSFTIASGHLTLAIFIKRVRNKKKATYNLRKKEKIRIVQLKLREVKLTNTWRAISSSASTI